MSINEPPQLDLNTPVPITLPLGAWNTILGLIMEGPWKVSDPIVQVIRQQIAQVAQSRPQRPPSKAGEDGQPS